MNRNQLANLINYIKPKQIFPIHTENPRLFKKVNKNVNLVRYGKKYTI